MLWEEENCEGLYFLNMATVSPILILHILQLWYSCHWKLVSRSSTLESHFVVWLWLMEWCKVISVTYKNYLEFKLHIFSGTLQLGDEFACKKSIFLATMQCRSQELRDTLVLLLAILVFDPSLPRKKWYVIKQAFKQFNTLIFGSYEFVDFTYLMGFNYIVIRYNAIVIFIEAHWLLHLQVLEK